MGQYAYKTPEKKLAFEELTERRHKSGLLCPKNKADFCFITFVDNDQAKRE